MAAVTICSDFGAQENKVYHCFHCFPSICHEVMGLDVMILVFWMLSFKPAFSFFSLSSFTFIKKPFSSSWLSAIRVVTSGICSYWYFSKQSWFQLVFHPALHFIWYILHISQISRVTIYSLDILLSQGVCCFMSISNCCFLTCVQSPQEAGKGGLVFPSLLEFSTVSCDPHSQQL